MWVAVYDILLDWIDPTDTNLHPVCYDELRRPTHVTIPTPLNDYTLTAEHLSNSYADDLATITTGPRAYLLQHQQAE